MPLNAVYACLFPAWVQLAGTYHLGRQSLHSFDLVPLDFALKVYGPATNYSSGGTQLPNLTVGPLNPFLR